MFAQILAIYVDHLISSGLLQKKRIIVSDALKGEFFQTLMCTNILRFQNY